MPSDPLGLAVFELSRIPSWRMCLGRLDGSISNSKSTFTYPPKSIPLCFDMVQMLFAI